MITHLVMAQDGILARRISISFDHVELRESLKVLQSKLGIPIAFNSRLPGMKAIVNEVFIDARVDSVVNTILKGKSLDYRLIGNQITIFRKGSLINLHTDSYREVKKSSISGLIIDENGRKALPFINVSIEGTNWVTMTNAQGQFSIKGLNQGAYHLLISAIGFKSVSLDIELKADENLILDTIILHEGAIALKEVTITPGVFSVMSSKPLSMQTLTERDIKNMSFSEDITRAVSRLPGVSSNDYSSKFSVRGSDTDEVLMNLDGMELYDPFHQRDFVGGLFSVVDIEVVQGVDLYTGGFSSEFGNKQSAVFNMQSKKVINKRRSSVGLSVMNARFYTEGTYGEDKGTYIFSTRKGLLDLALKRVKKKESLPRFYDLFGRIDYKLNQKHKLSLHLLHAGDKTKIRDVEEDAFEIHDTEYGNSYAWLTLRSIYNDKLSLRSILYGGLLTQDRSGDALKDEDHDKLEFVLRDDRDLSFIGIKQDWHWHVNDNILLKAGFDFKQLNSDYDYALSLSDVRVDSTGEIMENEEDRSIRKKPEGQQTAAYISSRFTLLPKVFVETGLRYDHISYTDEDFFSPRVSATYAITKRTFLRGAWGHYYQPQFIYNMEVNFGLDDFRKAEMAKHYVLALEHQFSNGLNLRLEGYYKRIKDPSVSYQNLRDAWEVFPETRTDIVKLDIDGARAKGIEFFAKYDAGKKISCWFSYSLAKAEEKVRNIEYNGLLDKRTGWLPKASNQNHTIYCDLNYRMNRNWHFNLSWQYYEGWPQTSYEYDFGTLEDDEGEEEIFFFTRHNKFRGEKYPAYHRMDLRINRHFYLKNSKISAYLHLINLYDKKNLRKFDLDVDVIDDESDPVEFQILSDHKYWLGTVPVIGVSWEF